MFIKQIFLWFKQWLWQKIPKTIAQDIFGAP